MGAGSWLYLATACQNRNEKKFLLKVGISDYSLDTRMKELNRQCKENGVFISDAGMRVKYSVLEHQLGIPVAKAEAVLLRMLRSRRIRCLSRPIAEKKDPANEGKRKMEQVRDHVMTEYFVFNGTGEELDTFIHNLEYALEPHLEDEVDPFNKEAVRQFFQSYLDEVGAEAPSTYTLEEVYMEEADALGDFPEVPLYN